MNCLLEMKKSHKESELENLLNRTLREDLRTHEIVVIDSKFRVQHANDCFLEKFGINYGQLINQPCYQIMHQRSVPCLNPHGTCPVVNVCETNRPMHTSRQHVDPLNRRISHYLSAYPIEINGNVKQVAVILRDFSEKARSEMHMMMGDKLDSIKVLSAGVAHEINNPLTTILTTAMLIQEDLDPNASYFRELDLIANETQRCKGIIDSLLQFAGHIKPKKSAHDIKKIIDESILSTIIMTQKKQIFFSNICNDSIPSIHIDKDQIMRAMINLLMNAIEASEPGMGIFIETCRSEKHRCIEIKISNRGVGIEEDAVHKIFQPFFTTKETGSGLGLAVAHGIIENHEGSIQVSSQKVGGTDFIVQLPIS